MFRKNRNLYKDIHLFMRLLTTTQKTNYTLTEVLFDRLTKSFTDMVNYKGGHCSLSKSTRCSSSYEP